MPLQNKNELLIKEAFQKLEDVYIADNIKLQADLKFAFFGQRVIPSGVGKNKKYPQLNCLCVGQMIGTYKNKSPDYFDKIRYRELPSLKMRYLPKESVVFIFPDDIVEMLLLQDYINDIKN